MENAFNEIYDKVNKENYNVSYKDSEEFFSKLYAKIKEQMDQLEILSYDIIVSNWQKLREVLIFINITIVLFRKRKRTCSIRSSRNTNSSFFI